MSVIRLGSGSPWEGVVGYSRTVRAGDFVFVSGTTATVDGEVVHEGDAYAQTLQALTSLEDALHKAGARIDEVVQTRMFVTDISRWEEYGRAHGEKFGGVRPVTSMLGVAALLDPRMMVEVEAVAYVGADAG